MHTAINFFLDLVFPPFCQGCAREGSYLCLACQNTIESPIHRCPKCNQNSPLGKIHRDCGNSRTGLTGLMVAAEYSNPAVKNLIWRLKYHSVRDISETLATIMADFIVRSDLVDYFQKSLIIPVPMHSGRVRYRGFNQAEEISRHLAKNLGLDFTPALKKSKKTDRQVELPREKRFTNVENAFMLNPLFAGNELWDKTILLIDDVVTTGATLEECARVLRKFHPAEIWGLVVARN